MGGKKGGGENSKKAAGNAKKAAAAAEKEATAKAIADGKEDQQWAKGAKDASKKQNEADKKAEAARKKAERDALLAEEEQSQRSTPKGTNAKSATKKSKGTLDLSQLDSPTKADDGHNQTAPTLNASGIDNALDAMSLATANDSSVEIDRHPERRLKKAQQAFAEQRGKAIAEENPGLRQSQRKVLMQKEFEKSDFNPFRQAGAVGHDATKEEIGEVRRKVRKDMENRLEE